MSRQLQLLALSVGLALVLFPLAVGKPGLPPTFKADEPAYYLAALSLAHDRDLTFDLGDQRRLFREYPYTSVHNVILMTDDGWNSVYYGKPYAYSLLAAPAAALFGANGMVAFNMALYVLMIGMGYSFLRRFNPDVLALGFAAGFFILSSGFVYVFWLHPEVFMMASAMVCLYLVLHDFGDDRPSLSRFVNWRRRWFGASTRTALSGAALALGVYHKPMLAAFALPALFVLWRRRGLAGVATWIAGALVTGGLLGAVAWGLTGHPSAYLGVERAGLSLHTPDDFPVEPRPLAPPPSAVGDDRSATGGGKRADRSRANSWHWLARIPEFEVRHFLEDGGYFLWGRHTGLFVYMPFSLIALALFLLHARRDPERWVTLGAVASIAVFFLIWIDFNWHGGGGFVGNRYIVMAYPALLFLVREVRPLALVPVGYAVAGLLVGPLVFTPLGVPVPHPTLQAHVRNPPMQWFPFELSLRTQIPGYDGVAQAGAWLQLRKDIYTTRGEELFLQGATPIEILMMSARPLTSAVFEVTNFAPGNRIRLSMPGDTAELDFDGEVPASGQRQRLTLRPGRPSDIRREDDGTLNHVYELAFYAERGQPINIRPERRQRTYAGASLAYLGPEERLSTDYYRVTWGRCRVPRGVDADDTFTVVTRLTNASEHAWPNDGPARVRLSYRWRDAEGGELPGNRRRTDLPRSLAPGESAGLEQLVDAPGQPGSYTLELDLVFEHVAWFSERGAETQSHPVRVRRAAVSPADDE